MATCGNCGVGVGWDGIITNVVVVLKKSVKGCGCFQEPYRMPRARYGRCSSQEQCALTWVGFAETLKRNENKNRKLSWDVGFVGGST